MLFFSCTHTHTDATEENFKIDLIHWIIENKKNGIEFNQFNRKMFQSKQIIRI